VSHVELRIIKTLDIVLNVLRITNRIGIIFSQPWVADIYLMFQEGKYFVSHNLIDTAMNLL
jgi:hypothetical protein